MVSSDSTRPRARGRCARTRVCLPRRALRQGQHADPHAAQSVGAGACVVESCISTAAATRRA
eukprot:6837521-Prymnesium_polylepis.1